MDSISYTDRLVDSAWLASLLSPGRGSKPPGQCILLFEAGNRGLVEKGLAPHQKIGFYCGTGWWASEAFFIARLLGWRNVSVFDGGWLEWSTSGRAVALDGADPYAA